MVDDLVFEDKSVPLSHVRPNRYIKDLYGDVLFYLGDGTCKDSNDHIVFIDSTEKVLVEKS
jgi:hypothetical protein